MAKRYIAVCKNQNPKSSTFGAIETRELKSTDFTTNVGDGINLYGVIFTVVEIVEIDVTKYLDKSDKMLS